ncbi:MAG: flippase [Candidatus Falkowbacteria bacterium]|nr:flippase [Candidatus Falkowbacteria bacterium]
MANIAKNTSYFTLALVLQKIISLTYFTIYARALGPADLGQYYFALSITSIFSIFIDLGLSNVVTREVAKYPEKARSILASTIAVKLPLAILTVLAVVAWSFAWGYSPIIKQLIYISSLAMVFDSFTGIFYSVSRGFHNLKFESISSIIFQLIILVLSLVILDRGGSINYLMAALLIASIFNFVYSFSVIKLFWKLSVTPIWDKPLIKKLFSMALPFGLFVIVQRFYTYFDSVLLFKLAGDKAVGLYQVPFKIIVALQFLPMAFVASLYPVLSTYWHSNREKLALAFEKAITYCLLLAIPVSLGSFAMADKIVLLFKEQYSETGLLLRISMMAAPFMFLGFPVGSMLNACDRQKRNTINMTITAIVSAVLNLVLIPRYGVLGACITTLVTSILMLVLGWVVIPQITKLHWRAILWSLFKILAAGLTMLLVVELIKSHLNPFITIAIAGLVYVVAVYVFRAVTRDDIKGFILSIKGKDGEELID